MNWEDVAVYILAFVGSAVIVNWVFQFLRKAWDALCKLNKTLTEAVAVLKEYRADFAVLRQIQEAGVTPNFGPTQEPSAEDREPTRAPAYPFPAPVYERFRQEPVRAPEPEAEDEPGDVTGEDRDLIDAEKLDKLRQMGFEAPEPEDEMPAGREVNSE